MILIVGAIAFGIALLVSLGGILGLYKTHGADQLATVVYQCSMVLGVFAVIVIVLDAVFKAIS